MKDYYEVEFLKLRFQTAYVSQRVLARLFESDYVNPKTGFSRLVTIKELEMTNINYRTTNGGGWCRGDNAGYLGKRYNVVRIKDNHGRIIGVRTTGFKTQ